MNRKMLKKHSWEDPALRPGTHVRWEAQGKRRNGERGPFEAIYLGERFWMVWSPVEIFYDAHLHDCITRALRRHRRAKIL